MMIKLKKNFLSVLMLAAVVTMLMVPLTTYAAFTQTSEVVGNGVRLRRTPGNGTIIGLMYEPETILIDDEILSLVMKQDSSNSSIYKDDIVKVSYTNDDVSIELITNDR